MGILLAIFAAGHVFSQQTTKRLRMSTTTSTENSGLLSVLLSPFEKKTGYKVDVIAVGTGKALQLGRNGDVDVVFVHDRKGEDTFVAEGFGVNRMDVMHNDFIIVGPAHDPARIRGLSDAKEAFKRIAQSGTDFISRGDESGTHVKEKDVWAAVGVKPQGKWYKEVGQGMGEVLTMANNLQAYTLADRATFIAYRKKVQLTLLVEGDPVLVNPYGVIAVNPKKLMNVDYDGAMAFINFVVSAEGQNIIRNFKLDGEQLFYPDAIK